MKTCTYFRTRLKKAASDIYIYIYIYIYIDIDIDIAAKNCTEKFDVHETVQPDIIMKVTNKMQLYRLSYYSLSALHVSGDVFAHHQEHLTVFKASGSIHTSCCRLVSWMSWNWTMWIVRRVYTRLTIHIVQQLGWIISDAVNTVKCSWWWAKTSPETCRAD